MLSDLILPDAEARVIQIDLNSKYILQFTSSVSKADLNKAREYIDEWLKTPNTPFLLITRDVKLVKKRSHQRD